MLIFHAPALASSTLSYDVVNNPPMNVAAVTTFDIFIALNVKTWLSVLLESISSYHVGCLMLSGTNCIQNTHGSNTAHVTHNFVLHSLQGHRVPSSGCCISWSAILLLSKLSNIGSTVKLKTIILK